MKNYKITIMETRVATYDIQADSLTDAKDIAKCKLRTQTEPKLDPNYSYSYKPKEITNVKWSITDRWITVW